jgi:hypothetical protein
MHFLKVCYEMKNTAPNKKLKTAVSYKNSMIAPYGMNCGASLSVHRDYCLACSKN